jgi:K+-sensing histidine kinase KdpD
MLIMSARGTPGSLLVPVVFIVVIILCARYFGLLAGILGSVAASSLFAMFLFEPYGSLHVKNQEGLFNIALLLFAGIALSYANADSEDEAEPHGKS